MRRIRSFILSLFPRDRAAAIEAESRSWRIRCTACGHTESVWDAGGLRAGAAGNPSHRKRCRSCGRVGVHQVERSTGTP